MIDKLKPFDIITGVPGVRYQQDGKRFNCGGHPVDIGPELPPDEPVAKELEEFACEECGKVLETESGLRMHRIRMHPVAVGPEAE